MEKTLKRTRIKMSEKLDTTLSDSYILKLICSVMSYENLNYVIEMKNEWWQFNCD